MDSKKIERVKSAQKEFDVLMDLRERFESALVAAKFSELDGSFVRSSYCVDLMCLAQRLVGESRVVQWTERILLEYMFSLGDEEVGKLYITGTGEVVPSVHANTRISSIGDNQMAEVVYVQLVDALLNSNALDPMRKAQRPSN